MGLKNFFTFNKKKDHVSEKHEEHLKNGHFGINRDFQAEMDQRRLEDAVETSELPPYFDRFPLHSIYKHSLVDLHLQSQIGNLSNEVIEEPFVVEDAAGNVNEEITKHLEDSAWFYAFVREYINTVYWGVTLMDFYPNDEGTDFKKMQLVNRLLVNPDRGLVLFNEFNLGVGIPYREEPFNKWLLEFNNVENPLGMLRSLSREAIWKYYARKDWSIHGEGFGMPWTVGYMDSEARRAKFVAELSASGNKKVSALTQEDRVEYVLDTRQNPQQMYASQVDVCNKEMSKGIVGNTESAEASTSSGYAQAAVHENRLISNSRARMREVKTAVNETLFPFIRQVLPGMGLAEDARFDYMLFKVQKQMRYMPQPDQEQEQNNQGGVATLNWPSFFSVKGPAKLPR